MTDVPRITLLPVGNPDRRALGDLARDLSGMGFDVELAERRLLPQGAFDASRGQFHADALLRLARSVRAERVLAVTDADLYAGDLNFVFGSAHPTGEACVISLSRLYLDADEERFRGRALKEAMHELGHIFGLGHCTDPGCVMWFSNTLGETDRKGTAYCPRCEDRIETVRSGAAHDDKRTGAELISAVAWFSLSQGSDVGDEIVYFGQLQRHGGHWMLRCQDECLEAFRRPIGLGRARPEAGRVRALNCATLPAVDGMTPRTSALRDSPPTRHVCAGLPMCCGTKIAEHEHSLEREQ